MHGSLVNAALVLQTPDAYQPVTDQAKFARLIIVLW